MSIQLRFEEGLEREVVYRVVEKDKKKKQIEAGILLYALFMSAVFSLLLQFYLNRQVAERQILLCQSKPDPSLCASPIGS